LSPGISAAPANAFGSNSIAFVPPEANALLRQRRQGKQRHG
jgi:hypothetical protein